MHAREQVGLHDAFSSETERAKSQRNTSAATAAPATVEVKPAPANPAPAATVFAAPESSSSALVGKAQAEEKPSQPADQKEAKQEKTTPAYTGEEVLHGTITGPIVGLAKREEEAKKEEGE